MSAGYDAQLQNTSDRNVRQYSDLDLFFGKKTSDNDISKVTDVEAVKRSIRNLVQLNVYDKPFHPEVSGGVREMLFENMTPLISTIIARQIEDVIERFAQSSRLSEECGFDGIQIHCAHGYLLSQFLSQD